LETGDAQQAPFFYCQYATDRKKKIAAHEKTVFMEDKS
jgi:hypothetical protein